MSELQATNPGFLADMRNILVIFVGIYGYKESTK